MIHAETRLTDRKRTKQSKNCFFSRTDSCQRERVGTRFLSFGKKVKARSGFDISSPKKVASLFTISHFKIFLLRLVAKEDAVKSLKPRPSQYTTGKIEPLTRPTSSSKEERGEEKDKAVADTAAATKDEMAAPATLTATLPPQEGAFAPSHIASGSSHPAAAAASESFEATRIAETAAAATLDASTAAVSAELDAQATSEAVSSTLMGIALLAFLQGSGAKHEASSAPGGVCGSSAAPSSSQQGGHASAARPVAAGTSATAAAHPPLHERLPPRRYQRMSPVDADAPTEPLIRTLAAIKATQSKAQYTCKRY